MRVFGLTAALFLLTAGLSAAEKPVTKPNAIPPKDALWQPYRITPRTGAAARRVGRHLAAWLERRGRWRPRRAAGDQ